MSAPHPRPYKRRMWDYKVADVSSIREFLMNIDCYFESGDLEPNLMVDKFTEIILSVVAENVPNRVITVNEKDPPWITKEVKTAVRRKHRDEKIRDEAIVLLLKLIYTNCLEKGVYPNLWEKANVPFHRFTKKKAVNKRKIIGQSRFYQSVASCLKK